MNRSDTFDCITDDDGHPYFEGPEKLLEVWFKSSRSEVDPDNNRWGLRSVDRKVWDEMLGLVQCQILNTLSNDYMDSFLLR